MLKLKKMKSKSQLLQIETQTDSDDNSVDIKDSIDSENSVDNIETKTILSLQNKNSNQKQYQLPQQIINSNQHSSYNNKLHNGTGDRSRSRSGSNPKEKQIPNYSVVKSPSPRNIRQIGFLNQTQSQQLMSSSSSQKSKENQRYQKQITEDVDDIEKIFYAQRQASLKHTKNDNQKQTQNLETEPVSNQQLYYDDAQNNQSKFSIHLQQRSSMEDNNQIFQRENTYKQNQLLIDNDLSEDDKPQYYKKQTIIGKEKSNNNQRDNDDNQYEMIMSSNQQKEMFEIHMNQSSSSNFTSQSVSQQQININTYTKQITTQSNKSNHKKVKYQQDYDDKQTKANDNQYQKQNTNDKYNKQSTQKNQLQYKKSDTQEDRNRRRKSIGMRMLMSKESSIGRIEFQSEQRQQSSSSISRNKNMMSDGVSDQKPGNNNNHSSSNNSHYPHQQRLSLIRDSTFTKQKVGFKKQQAFGFMMDSIQQQSQNEIKISPIKKSQLFNKQTKARDDPQNIQYQDNNLNIKKESRYNKQNTDRSNNQNDNHSSNPMSSANTRQYQIDLELYEEENSPPKNKNTKKNNQQQHMKQNKNNKYINYEEDDQYNQESGDDDNNYYYTNTKYKQNLNN
eukprot:403334055